MNALPWTDTSFDVVTSFRGIWGTTPNAVAEVHRVLARGGRIGITVWGHIKASPGAWAFAPFTLAADEKVQNQAAMVALGRPGVGRALLEDAGFCDIDRVDLPFVFEFADPESYARALASTGPAFEAIQAVGEKAFFESAVEIGRQQAREGLPLRAPIVPWATSLSSRFDGRPAARLRRSAVAPQSPTGFLSSPPQTPEARRLIEDDLEGVGYATNVSSLWGYMPACVLESLSQLMGEVTRSGSFPMPAAPCS